MIYYYNIQLDLFYIIVEIKLVKYIVFFLVLNGHIEVHTNLIQLYLMCIPWKNCENIFVCQYNPDTAVGRIRVCLRI